MQEIKAKEILLYWKFTSKINKLQTHVISNLFGNCLTTAVSEQIPNISGTIYHYRVLLMPLQNLSMNFCITDVEVAEVINNLKNKKTIGIDNIHIALLKKISWEILRHLSKLIKSFSQ